MIKFGREVLSNFEIAKQKEFLEVNNLGGYASSTIIFCNTRRYHGVFVVAIPEERRFVLVSKLEEVLVVKNKEIYLSTNQYPDIIYPQGYQYLEEFNLHFFPTFLYLVNDLRIEKKVFMPYLTNTVIITYKLISKNHNSIKLKLFPLFAFRDYHSLTRENQFVNPDFKNGKFISIKPYSNLPELKIYFNGENFGYSFCWYKNIQYYQEKDRGLDFEEDNFCYGYFEYELKNSQEAFLVFTIENDFSCDIKGFERKEQERRNNIIKDKTSDFKKYLFLSADKFIVKRENRKKTILAGYHWFTDWGRDTFISLPGVCLATGRFDDAKEILQNFAEFCKGGLIPNRFPEYNQQPDYNTVDASLWFIYAVYKYYQYTKDKKFIEKILPVVDDIIKNYISGTLYNIKMDTDGLIYQGEEGLQLTWMDAKIGDYVVTPRIGKPVEIQALWYNVLMVRCQFGNCKLQIEKLSDKVKKSFEEKFWNEEKQCLYDVIDGDRKDSSIRPNQIFAISLPFLLFQKNKQKKIFDTVFEKLYTSFGLRSLSVDDKNYIGKYQGDVFQRDTSYHQGTVWPYFIGFFINAYFNVYRKNKHTVNFAKYFLSPFLNHLFDAGIGEISEIFEGDAPHHPRGCISQAWSTAEILRIIEEEKLI